MKKRGNNLNADDSHILQNLDEIDMKGVKGGATKDSSITDANNIAENWSTSYTYPSPPDAIEIPGHEPNTNDTPGTDTSMQCPLCE
ncbi:MAG: hypothetical protein LBJ95_04090 [Oscillospiraceae bacterium]|nr:hypothetical protein [Oscillospiraceae bacterium]